MLTGVATRVDYCRKIRPIAPGHSGTLVWLARDTRSDREVALKLIPSIDGESQDRIAAEHRGALLQKEFAAAYGLVPEVYDEGAYEDDFYAIVMEYVGGVPLSDLIAEGPMAPRVAAERAIAIGDFLEKAHAFHTTVEGQPYDRIVHADLKPAHIVFPASGGIKVLDFGTAKAMLLATPMTTNKWGTIHYASPERLESGGRVNELADFWSLGVILYEMICGHRPYVSLESDASALERAIVRNSPRAALPASCPPAVAAIVNKLLAYQPERRYPSAAHILDDLRSVVDGRDPVALDAFQKADRETVRIDPAPVTRRDVVPTEAMPPAVKAVDPPAARDAASPRQRPPRQPGRLIRAALTTLLIAIPVSESVAWIGAERLRLDLATLDARTLAQVRDHYNRVDAWSALDLGLHIRVVGLLTDRLTAIADQSIVAYRDERPNVFEAEWRQALDALTWASSLNPGSRAIRSRRRYCEGQILRWEARNLSPADADEKYQEAIVAFRDAAALDPRSPDPYIGLLRTYIYNVHDLDRALEAEHDLGERYKIGRRERAQIGDAYSWAGDQSVRRARAVTGDHHRAEIERALTYYNECVAAFSPILEFARSAANMETCKRRAATLARQIEAESAVPSLAEPPK